MPMLSVYVDEKTMERLEDASRRLGRPVEDLAEAAITDEAIRSERHHPPQDRELPLG